MNARKVVLLAIGLSALLLLAAVPAAEASRNTRSLKQWSDWAGMGWGGGWMWGPGFWGGPDPSSPGEQQMYDLIGG